MGDLVQLLVKLVLQHEDNLNVHRQDTAFTLYLSQLPPAGILSQPFKISQKWHQEREKPQTQAHPSLRVVIFGLMIQEMGQRLALLNSKEDAKKEAIKSGILTDAGNQLVPDPERLFSRGKRGTDHAEGDPNPAVVQGPYRSSTPQGS